MEKETDEFFENAFSMILEKLTNEEKVEYEDELAEEGKTFKELTPRNRFFSLVRFIEVKYVMMAKWIKSISKSLVLINESYNGESPLKDIVFIDEAQNKVSFGDFQKQEHKFEELADSFKQVLQQMELMPDYENYLRSSGLVREKEW